MMNKWRPEGGLKIDWEKIHKQTGNDLIGLVMAFQHGRISADEMLERINQRQVLASEAGADAMLDSLFKLAKESPNGVFTIDSHITILNGVAQDVVPVSRKGQDCPYEPLTCQEEAGCRECMIWKNNHGEIK
jgi:hypothetical protein